MGDSLAAVEAVLRFGAFLGVFVLVALWEVLAPKRQPVSPRAALAAQLGLIALNAGIVRLVARRRDRGGHGGRGPWLGLFNFVTLPSWRPSCWGWYCSTWPSTSSTSCFTRYPCCGGCTACTTPMRTTT